MVDEIRSRLEQALTDTGVIAGILVAWGGIFLALMILYWILGLLLFEVGGFSGIRPLVEVFDQLNRGLPLIVGYAAILNILLYAVLRAVRETITEWHVRETFGSSSDS